MKRAATEAPEGEEPAKEQKAHGLALPVCNVCFESTLCAGSMCQARHTTCVKCFHSYIDAKRCVHPDGVRFHDVQRRTCMEGCPVFMDGTNFYGWQSALGPASDADVAAYVTHQVEQGRPHPLQCPYYDLCHYQGHTVVGLYLHALRCTAMPAKCCACHKQLPFIPGHAFDQNFAFRYERHICDKTFSCGKCGLDVRNGLQIKHADYHRIYDLQTETDLRVQAMSAEDVVSLRTMRCKCPLPALAPPTDTSVLSEIDLQRYTAFYKALNQTISDWLAFLRLCSAEQRAAFDAEEEEVQFEVKEAPPSPRAVLRDARERAIRRDTMYAINGFSGPLFAAAAPAAAARRGR